MPTQIQIERVLHRRLEADPKDSLAYFPVSNVTSFDVTNVQPPTNGANNAVDLRNALLLLLQSRSGDKPQFDLYYVFHDPAQDSTVNDGLRTTLGRSTFRYQVDDKPPLVWPLRSIKNLDPTRPPRGWRNKAVLAAFVSVPANACEICVLAPPPNPGLLPATCVAYCNPPTEDFEAFCKAFGC